jgi:hypothetical protein
MSYGDLKLGKINQFTIANSSLYLQGETIELGGVIRTDTGDGDIIVVYNTLNIKGDLILNDSTVDFQLYTSNFLNKLTIGNKVTIDAVAMTFTNYYNHLNTIFDYIDIGGEASINVNGSFELNASQNLKIGDKVSILSDNEINFVTKSFNVGENVTLTSSLDVTITAQTILTGQKFNISFENVLGNGINLLTIYANNIQGNIITNGILYLKYHPTQDLIYIGEGTPSAPVLTSSRTILEQCYANCSDHTGFILNAYSIKTNNLYISNNASPDPLYIISLSTEAPAIFGLDENWFANGYPGFTPWTWPDSPWPYKSVLLASADGRIWPDYSAPPEPEVPTPPNLDEPVIPDPPIIEPIEPPFDFNDPHLTEKDFQDYFVEYLGKSLGMSPEEVTIASVSLSVTVNNLEEILSSAIFRNIMLKSGFSMPTIVKGSKLITWKKLAYALSGGKHYSMLNAAKSLGNAFLFGLFVELTKNILKDELGMPENPKTADEIWADFLIDEIFVLLGGLASGGLGGVAASQALQCLERLDDIITVSIERDLAFIEAESSIRRHMLSKANVLLAYINSPDNNPYKDLLYTMLMDQSGFENVLTYKLLGDIKVLDKDLPAFASLVNNFSIAMGYHILGDTDKTAQLLDEIFQYTLQLNDEITTRPGFDNRLYYLENGPVAIDLYLSLMEFYGFDEQYPPKTLERVKPN